APWRDRDDRGQRLDGVAARRGTERCETDARRGARIWAHLYRERADTRKCRRAAAALLRHRMHRSAITVRTPGRGLIELTERIDQAVRDAGVIEGLCNVFVPHTS